jgi:ribosomal protein S18 acetylase RimI-like enzyme
VSYSIEKITDNKDIASLIGLYMQDSFNNPLLLGDLNAPMNKLCDAFKVVNKRGDIQTGFTIFNGTEIPVIVFPYGNIEHWDLIRNYVNNLNLSHVMIIYPIGLEGKTDRVLPPPWLNWNEYAWQIQNIDYSMKFTKENLEIVSIEHLPKLRGATLEDADNIQKFFNKHETKENWFLPTQLESELSVLSEDKGRIVGFAGTHFETPYTAQLGNVFVDPQYRRKGLGKALSIAVTLGIIRSKRVPTLFVNEHNLTGQKMYENIGFEKINRFAFYIGFKE